MCPCFQSDLYSYCVHFSEHMDLFCVSCPGVRDGIISEIGYIEVCSYREANVFENVSKSSGAYMYLLFRPSSSSLRGGGRAELYSRQA